MKHQTYRLCGAIFVPLLFLLSVAADLSGQWTGTMEAAGRPGTVELTLTRDGAEWNATVRVTWNGMEFANPVTALKVTENDIAFTTEIAGASARFIGKVTGQQLSGTLEATRNGQVVGTGKWTLTRSATPATATSAPLPKPNRVIGAVQTIDATSGQLSLKLDSGEIVTVKLSAQTALLRVPPGETNLQKAANIALAVVGIGDRVFATGQLAANRTFVIAQQVIVMAKADVAAQQERELAEWRTRSIVGTITAINPTAKEITVLMRSSAGEKPMVIPVNDSVRLRRYAPDSTRFSDAQPSSYAAFRVGDQLRARGEKRDDGSRFTPEEIVFGTFRTFGGAILAINATTREVKIQDQRTQQSLTVTVNSDSLLRRLPPELTAQLAKRMRTPKSSANEPDWQSVIKRLPVLALTDLQRGERVIVSSTSGASPNRVTAISFLTGVEALLKKWQKQQGSPDSNANMSLGLPGGALEGLGRP